MVRHTPSPYPTAPALLPTTAPASSAGIPDSSTASATIGSAPSPATAPAPPTPTPPPPTPAPFPAARMPALTGDVTTSAGSVATTLKNTGTAGTYTKITFDAQGRETSGTTLSAGDIPAIPESGVTSLVTDLSQRQLTNEPGSFTCSGSNWMLGV